MCSLLTGTGRYRLVINGKEVCGTDHYPYAVDLFRWNTARNQFNHVALLEQGCQQPWMEHKLDYYAVTYSIVSRWGSEAGPFCMTVRCTGWRDDLGSAGAIAQITRRLGDEPDARHQEVFIKHFDRCADRLLPGWLQELEERGLHAPPAPFATSGPRAYIEWYPSGLVDGRTGRPILCSECRMRPMVWEIYKQFTDRLCTICLIGMIANKPFGGLWDLSLWRLENVLTVLNAETRQRYQLNEVI